MDDSRSCESLKGSQRTSYQLRDRGGDPPDDNNKVLLCGKCGIEKREKLISCYKCSNPFHIGCVNINNNEHALIIKLKDCLSWFCPNCKICKDKKDYSIKENILNDADISKKLENIEKILKKQNEEITQIKDKHAEETTQTRSNHTENFEQPRRMMSYAEIMEKSKQHMYKTKATSKTVNEDKHIFVVHGIDEQYHNMDLEAVKEKISEPSIRVRGINWSKQHKLFISLESADEVDKLYNQWNTDCLGVNATKEQYVKNYQRYTITAFSVDREIDTQSIKQELKTHNIMANNIIRQKRNDGEATTVIRILLSDLQSAKHAIENGILLRNKKLRVEWHTNQPRRCQKCQLFGHSSRYCRAKTPNCGKCAKKHETKNCTESNEKCVNCGSNHTSDSKQCPRYITLCNEMNEHFLC